MKVFFFEVFWISVFKLIQGSFDSVKIQIYLIVKTLIYFPEKFRSFNVLNTK